MVSPRDIQSLVFYYFGLEIVFLKKGSLTQLVQSVTLTG
jgi:hypothetical protein